MAAFWEWAIYHLVGPGVFVACIIGFIIWVLDKLGAFYRDPKTFDTTAGWDNSHTDCYETTDRPYETPEIRFYPPVVVPVDPIPDTKRGWDVEETQPVACVRRSGGPSGGESSGGGW